MDEGRNVRLGIIEDRKGEDVVTADAEKEDPEEKEQRLSNYDGILDKEDHLDVLKDMEEMSDDEKNNTFVFFDYNDVYPLVEKVLEMGFTKGIFPTEFYYNLEKDRALAKDFVKKHYRNVKVAEEHEFNDIEDGIEFLNDTDEFWVLKSYSSLGKTVVPKTDDLEVSRLILIDALEKNREGYETSGFLLEKKIKNGMEITPIKVYYNGKPVYTLAEFENKEYGAGNIGCQKGGNQALSVRTNLNCRLNQIAFPAIIDQLASNQPGLSVYDAGLMYDGKTFWFTEFCSMRFGFDGIFSEITMRDNGTSFVSDYFEDIVKGKNPLRNKFGASLRLFNLEGSGVTTKEAQDDVPLFWDDRIDNNLFLYRVKEKDGQIVSVGGFDLLGTITGAGNSIQEAVNKVYTRVDDFFFEKIYYRPKFDFLSRDYNSSILNRYNAMARFL